MIRCLAPLPEGLENPVLENMLEVAPCPVPLKEDTGADNTGGRGPPSLPVPTEGMSASMKEDNRGRKRTASEDPKAEASKQEKKSPTKGPASGGALAAQSPRGGSALQRVVSDPENTLIVKVYHLSSEKITAA